MLWIRRISRASRVHNRRMQTDFIPRQNKIYSFRPRYDGFVTALKTQVQALGTPVILCIGSDRLTGDCLGPLVGNALVHEYDVPAFVYGTLGRTVTALNLDETIAFIRRRHPESKLLVVDASLGCARDVGSVRIIEGGIRPGSASGKDFTACGDLAVTAVVNRLPSSTLSSTKLGFVHDLAGVIAVAIASAIAGIIVPAGGIA